MRLVTKSILIFLAAYGSLALSACGNSEQATTAVPTPPADSEAVTTTMDDGHDSQHQGHTGIHSDIVHAQIIMSGPYHLELIAESKDHGINLNFHLENNANQEPILGANVTAVVDTPDGNQETLDLQYEAEGEHYIGSLETQATGQFQVAILADIDGEQVDADFAFER